MDGETSNLQHHILAYHQAIAGEKPNDICIE